MAELINVDIISTKRKEKGFPQSKVAEILNLDQSSISNIERGKKELTLTEAIKLAETLDFNLSDLIRKN